MKRKNCELLEFYFDGELFDDDNIYFISKFLSQCVNNTNDNSVINTYRSNSCIKIEYYKKPIPRKKNKDNNPNIGNKEKTK